MNKKLANFLFGICILFCFVSIVWSFYTHKNEIEIPVLGHINADIRMNIEAKKEAFQDIKILFNGNLQEPYFMKASPIYGTYEINSDPVYNIALVAENKNTIKSIDNIVLTNGYKLFYFTGDDILKFKNKNGIYLFPDKIKFDKNSSYINDKGKLKTLSFGILSLFYNMKFYIISYIWFILAVLTYLLNKEKIDLSFNFMKNKVIWLILLLGILFRLQDAKFTFWDDELFTACVAGSPDFSFKSVLVDSFNPPLFYILAKFWGLIFGQNEQLLRLLPCVFSVIGIYILYYFVKKNLNEKYAIICAFLMAINIYSIHSAQEYRSYALCIMFSLLSAYLLFEIIKNKKNKDFIFYGVLAALMANTHYYQIIILISNFIYGNIFLDRKGKIKFLFSNLFAAFTFIPFFFNAVFNDGVLGSVEKVPAVPTFAFMCEIFSKIFQSEFFAVIVLTVTVLIFIPKIRNKIFENDHKKYFNLYIYSFYTIIFVFVFVFVFSQIKSITQPYYFVNILPHVIIISLLIILLPLKNKYARAVVPCLLFVCYFNFGTYIKKTAYSAFENLFKFSFYDSLNYESQGKNIGVAIYDYPEYKNFYTKYIKQNEEFVWYKYNDESGILIDIIKQSKPDVIYIRLESKQYYEIAKELQKEMDVALIRTEGDVIIARIVKK